MVLRFLYGSTLTSIHDYWKNHGFDYMNLVDKVMSLLFNILSRLVIAFLPFNFMAAFTIHSNFGAQENKVYFQFSDQQQDPEP